MIQKMFRSAVVCAAIAGVCIAIGPAVRAAADKIRPETNRIGGGPAIWLAARSLDATGTYAGKVEIVVERWSTDVEGQKMAEAVSKGPAALLAALAKLRVRNGYVLTPGIQSDGARALLPRAWNIGYAREIKTAAGRRVVVASAEHLPIGEVPSVKHTDTHEVMVVDVRFGPDGRGIGKIGPASKVMFNKDANTIELAQFDAEQVRLTDVAPKQLAMIDAPKQRPPANVKSK